MLQTKTKRSYIRQFSLQDQESILKIYNSTEDKSIALLKIKSLPRCQHLEEQKIIRWMTKSKTGKHISTEFEGEVLAECKKLHHYIINRNSYTYSIVQECAKKIFDKDYWDNNSKSFIKRWHYDKRTCKLQFSNKWVYGMLKRNHNVTTLTEVEKTTGTSFVENLPIVEYLSSSTIKRYKNNEILDNITTPNMMIPNEEYEFLDSIDDFLKLFDESHLVYINHNNAVMNSNTTTTMSTSTTSTTSLLNQQQFGMCDDTRDDFLNSNFELSDLFDFSDLCR